MRCVCLVTTVITDQTQPSPPLIFLKHKVGFQKDQEKYQMENIGIFVTIILLNLSKLNQFGSI